MYCSVILCTLNEEKTIGNIIDIIKSDPNVREIIVVDDKSQDNTVNIAKEKGAKVIYSTKVGKGASMREGKAIATQDILVYLDADITTYPNDIISKLTTPILKNECDIVKATFKREAGRVTELVAKPLLAILFPELSSFSQPLSGVIAGKRTVFEQLTFEDGYGVDIGILIDACISKAKILEINIGKVEHKSKTWRQLIPMASEVSSAILKRAAKLNKVDLDTLETVNIIRDQLEYQIKQAIVPLKKMVIFDLDNTILKSRFIEVAAELFGFKKTYLDIVSSYTDQYVVTKLLAKSFKGIKYGNIIKLVDEIPIVDDTINIISELKKRGYVVGIITNGYDIVANHIKIIVGADFAIGNELEFSQSVATGEVKIPYIFVRNEKSICNHLICKTNALLEVLNKYGITLSNTIGIGDSIDDICLIKNAGIGISFCATNPIVKEVADYIIEERSFKNLLEIAP